MKKSKTLISIIVTANTLFLGSACFAAVHDLSTSQGGAFNVAYEDAQGSYTSQHKKRSSSELDSLEFNFSAASIDNMQYERGIRRENKFDTSNIKRKVSDNKVYIPSHHEDSKPAASHDEDKQKHEYREDSDDRKPSHAVPDEFKKPEHHAYVPVASPVPEPETYAMVLAGLGLIMLTARRNKYLP